MTTLQTQRLILRPFKQDDLDAYANICADPEVMQFLGDGKPASRPEAWRHLAIFLGHWQLLGYGMWAVEEKASGRLMGRVGFINAEGWPGCELAWTLGKPFWGQGFATEAARIALEHGFFSLKFPRIISLIHPLNHRSIRVAERLGAVKEGTTELFGRSLLVYVHRRPVTT